MFVNKMEFTDSCLLSIEIGGGRGLFTIAEITTARTSADNRPDINRNTSIAQPQRMTKLETRVTISNGKNSEIFNRVASDRYNDSMTEIPSASMVNWIQIQGVQDICHPRVEGLVPLISS
jgi:hypothetical protein